MLYGEYSDFDTVASATCKPPDVHRCERDWPNHNKS